jgi:hypothetical protein
VPLHPSSPLLDEKLDLLNKLSELSLKNIELADFEALE